MRFAGEPTVTADPPILQFPARPPIRRRIPWRRLLVAALVVYWGALVTGTHIPHPPRVTEADGFDKWMHLGAYLGLGVLLSAVCVTRRPASLQLAIRIVVVIAVAGALDEITQPLVGRDCELWDWCADLVGGLMATAAVVGYAASRRRQQLAALRRRAG